MAAIKGLESMEFDIWSGILVHKNTPDPIVAVLNKAFLCLSRTAREPQSI